MSDKRKVIDRNARVNRMMLSLDGLSVGDAFGERFFCYPMIVRGRIEGRNEPPPPWFFTDDTAMAISIARCLLHEGCINRDNLARYFAEEYRRDPNRGYGGMAHTILEAIGSRVPWQAAAREAFDGQGSMGNGGAMRVAPLGAWFCDDFDQTMEQARASAEVTHAHPEGQAGAIAVAVAAAWAASGRAEGADGRELLETARRCTPEGATRNGISKALRIPFEAEVSVAVVALGNGSRVTAPDTVPFALWCAARHLSNYREALWATVSAGGDIDTNCAIVGGIVALSAGRASIPADWLTARERLPDLGNA